MNVRLSRQELEALSEEARVMFSWAPRVAQVKELPKARKSARVERVLSKDALDWLYDLSQRPFLQTTVRDRLLELTPERGKRAREELEQGGYVRRHVIPTGKRGGQLVQEEITDAGYELLAGMQVAAKKLPGKGGYLHKFWQHKVAEWLVGHHEGAKVKIEDAGSGKSVDVSLNMPSQPNDGARATAFEILVNGEDKELSNVRKDVESGYDEVVLCVDRWETMERLKEKLGRELEGDVMQRVRFQLLGQFLD